LIDAAKLQTLSPPAQIFLPNHLSHLRKHSSHPRPAASHSQKPAICPLFWNRNLPHQEFVIIFAFQKVDHLTTFLE
jgi:hypothetical protein